MCTIYIIYIVLFFSTIFYINSLYTNNYPENFININKYPELNVLSENHKVILSELKKILKNGLWSNYDDLHKKDIFRNSSVEEVIQKLSKSESKVNIETQEPKWKVFGLIFNKNIIEKNKEFCPNTVNLLKSIPCIVNAGFSCLEANKATDIHSDDNIDFFRYQLPLIVPEGDTGFTSNNYSIKYKINEPFIFNDSFEHHAWNYTNKIRVVLICDIERKK
jgi:hypothetical protein